MNTANPPGSSVLLLGADYYGTLAAARGFGKRGIRVMMADDNTRARALFSRHVSEKFIHPPLSQPVALVEWLVSWGEAHPGTLLYPPNDHLAWLFALHGARLGKVFRMYSPSETTILTLLDKTRLHAACASPEVGIEVPETHAVGTGGASDLALSQLRYPVLLKPRTQVFLESGIKGFIVRDQAQLASELARFRALVAFHPVLTERHPGIDEPMVQEYLSAAETSILSVSGFVAEDGSMVTRAAMKVLQRPRKVGIGLCFESREIEPELCAKIGALCKKVGYFGTFEAEFIASGDRRFLIDFNPRFYSQMAFDSARGASLPMLVWHAARGDASALAHELSRARTQTPTGREVYCHKTMLDLVLSLQRLSGQMSKEEVRQWRLWYDEHRTTMTDAVRDSDDQLPGLVDAALWVSHFAQHPRSFVRSFVFNR